MIKINLKEKIKFIEYPLHSKIKFNSSVEESELADSITITHCDPLLVLDNKLNTIKTRRLSYDFFKEATEMNYLNKIHKTALKILLII
jgi:hypothetical protein